MTRVTRNSVCDVVSDPCQPSTPQRQTRPSTAVPQPAAPLLRGHPAPRAGGTVRVTQKSCVLALRISKAVLSKSNFSTLLLPV